MVRYSKGLVSIRLRRSLCFCAAVLVAAILRATAASPGLAFIRTEDLRTWLAYIASDQLEGRGTYSPGLELAATYIADHLEEWKVQPAGDGSSYLQTVRVLSVKSHSRSYITVRAGDETRIFRDGDGVTFPSESGRSRTLILNRVEFAGYGVDAPSLGQKGLRGRDVSGAAVIYLAGSPRSVDPQRHSRLLSGRSRHLVEELGAAAALTQGALPPPATLTNPAADRRAQAVVADFETSERLDRPVPPAVAVSEGFLEFVFRTAPTAYAELKRRADGRSSLPSFTLPDVTITFTIDVDYDVISTRITRNVVGIVPGSDPQLSDTYVAFGAHFDHVGQGELEPGRDTVAPPLYGRTGSGPPGDRIWNGADDDGSGTVAMMALARAFAQGPRPRRSLLFVWHAGEELGTYGSRYFADYPTVPIDRIVAQLNIDMIGRNRDNRNSEANTVYLVGSDRISSELHALSQQANRSLAVPMQLDFEMNDPADPEQIYYRSDHYSYAAKGIPVIFFTTGLHPDYHTNADEVSKILFDKMTRVVALVYETGLAAANLDHQPLRDNKGPRAWK